YAFVRLVVLSALRLDEPLATKRILLGALCAAATAWAALAWRTVEHPGWRRAYGAVSVFALSYGILSQFANGLGGHMPPPGGWAGLAGFVPFAVLLAAVGRARAGSPQLFPVLLAAGVGPIVLDLVLRGPLPPATPAAAALNTTCAVLLAAAAAVRL